MSAAFPADDKAAHWVVLLSMAMNDLITLDTHIHESVAKDSPDSRYFLRLLCGALREIWRLVDQSPANDPEVAALVERLPDEATHALEELRSYFSRPASVGEVPSEPSWVELNLKPVRDATFHYPTVGSDELRRSFESCANEEVVVHEAGPRPFDFADMVALNATFGDIDDPEILEAYKEVIEVAGKVQRLVMTLAFGALGAQLRSQHLDPKSVFAVAT